MSEPRKNHLSIDGGQVKEDENVATYKPIPDSDAEFRNSKHLTKSKEKLSDEAEEKLLAKEDEAKIVTKVVMADAKYVVSDHRNGDANVKLDANKRQFSGLTREELQKYADDPFWVRLRWFMFILFWALWLCMLAGAIAIIIRAPKCPAPEPKKWYEKGPLVDTTSLDSYLELNDELSAIQSIQAEGIFTDVPPTYEVLDNPDALTQFRDFVAKAKELGIKVIVDLTPNFVPTSHEWFQLSVNRTPPFDRFFTWVEVKEYINGTVPKPPNNWVSTENTPAWEYNEDRKEFYLHQYGREQPDLNFHNEAVVAKFEEVLTKWMKAGADGVRLHNIRRLLVNTSYPDESLVLGQSSGAAGHLDPQFWTDQHTRDQPALKPLMKKWSKLVDDQGPNPGQGETVFTVTEEPKPSRLNLTGLRPRAAAPLPLQAGALGAALNTLRAHLKNWPALQLTVDPADPAEQAELVELALLLPATPVLDVGLLDQFEAGNDTATSEQISHLVSLRDDASVAHGEYELELVPARNSSLKLLACARWKLGRTGYVGVFNPQPAAARAELAALARVPAQLSVHHVSARVRGQHAEYKTNFAVQRDDVFVPAKSTVVLSFTPLKVTDE